MRKAHASETMSSVRATEQFLSRRTAWGLPADGLAIAVAEGVGFLAVAGRSTARVSLRQMGLADLFAVNDLTHRLNSLPRKYRSRRQRCGAAKSRRFLNDLPGLNQSPVMTSCDLPFGRGRVRHGKFRTSAAPTRTRISAGFE